MTEEIPESKPEALNAPSTFGGRRPSSGSDFEWTWGDTQGECYSTYAEMEVWEDAEVLSWIVDEITTTFKPQQTVRWGISVWNTVTDKPVLNSERNEIWAASKQEAVRLAEILAAACSPNAKDEP